MCWSFPRCVVLIAALLSAAMAVPVTLAQDLRSIVSRADLNYTAPASRSEEGMPLGNGRMGSLVWTTPSAIRFQINRPDVFAADCTTTSFPRTHTDYASGCGFVDVDFADFAAEVFEGTGFNQHLSVYDALMSLRGQGVSARLLAWHQRDVFAIEVDDQRPTPTAIGVNLRMLRYVSQLIRGRRFPATNPHSNTVPNGAHSATSAFEVAAAHLVLTQEFREHDYFNASAVAVGVVGRKAKVQHVNETTSRLLVEPGTGKFVILIGSASTFDPSANVAALAVAEIETAAAVGFDALLESNRAWWSDFWSRGYIDLHSSDGTADFVAQNYAYFLYVMASCSRGTYPARFGGMLWYSNGDLRSWGTQYWWANQSCYYNGLPAANRFELLDPTFSMYTKMYDSCAVAARQQWGSQGVWLPETSWFNGLARLPDDIAAEMQDLYLLRKPWAQRSDRFMRYAEAMQSFNSRWNWISQDGHWELGRWVLRDKGAPPFGHVTHIFGTTAKIALLYWQRYEYTQDADWLRQRAYPMLRGAVEFYRNFPNLNKEADGKYHLYHTNSNEPAWGVKDSDEDLSAMHGIIGPLIRASEILELDGEMRPVWREFLDNLAPIPTSELPDALKPEGYTGPRVWVKGLRPAAKAGGMLPDRNTLPQWNFDLCTVNSDDREMLALAGATFDAYFRNGLRADTPTGTLSRLPIAGAQLGRADAIRYLVPNQVRLSDGGTPDQPGIFRNRMALREGAGATECERLGRAAEALHHALLQSAPAKPGGEPILRVFPAWPNEWDASFKLLARGAFLVSASMKKGQIQSLKIESLAGSTLQLRNPWRDETVLVERPGQAIERASGELIRLATTKGQTLTFRPQAAPDAAAAPPPASRPAPSSWALATADTLMRRHPDYTKAYWKPWNYVTGYCLYGFEMLHRSTGDPRYLDFAQKYIDSFVDAHGNIKTVDRQGKVVDVVFNNLDNMMTGNTVVWMYEQTRDVRYRKAAEKIRRAFDTYPRTSDGLFWHGERLTGQVWIDGVFMGQMFLIRYGQSIGDREYCFDEATRQITLYAKRARKGDSGLFYHGWSESPLTTRWADKQTGLSSEVWSEGLGWYALILVETLAVLPQDHPRRSEVVDIFQSLAAALKRTQDPKTGRWFQVVDKADHPDNWTDTSGSAMFVYMLQRGIELGLLGEREYAPVVRRGYAGITDNARINLEGLVDIYSACDGLGVQVDYDRYINYRRKVNAKEAVGGFLWATAIVEKPKASN